VRPSPIGVADQALDHAGAHTPSSVANAAQRRKRDARGGWRGVCYLGSYAYRGNGCAPKCREVCPALWRHDLIKQSTIQRRDTTAQTQAQVAILTGSDSGRAACSRRRSEKSLPIGEYRSDEPTRKCKPASPGAGHKTSRSVESVILGGTVVSRGHLLRDSSWLMPDFCAVRSGSTKAFSYDTSQPKHSRPFNSGL
jgi:hypothetical protein